mmetsp:Transcript_63738/g.149406  ORF Transcript_63738/g.149406 Transcript_63738/m.149406 type:complete len:228 (+) Transcript_63738:339-1022(+)
MSTSVLTPTHPNWRMYPAPGPVDESLPVAFLGFAFVCKAAGQDLFPAKSMACIQRHHVNVPASLLGIVYQHCLIPSVLETLQDISEVLVRCNQDEHYGMRRNLVLPIQQGCLVNLTLNHMICGFGLGFAVHCSYSRVFQVVNYAWTVCKPPSWSDCPHLRGKTTDVPGIQKITEGFDNFSAVLLHLVPADIFDVPEKAHLLDGGPVVSVHKPCESIIVCVLEQPFNN